MEKPSHGQISGKTGSAEEGICQEEGKEGIEGEDGEGKWPEEVFLSLFLTRKEKGWLTVEVVRVVVRIQLISFFSSLFFLSSYFCPSWVKDG